MSHLSDIEKYKIYMSNIPSRKYLTINVYIAAIDTTETRVQMHAHNAGCMLDPALVASNPLDRRSTAEIPQPLTPRCTDLQFDFDDHDSKKINTSGHVAEKNDQTKPNYNMRSTVHSRGCSAFLLPIGLVSEP